MKNLILLRVFNTVFPLVYDPGKGGWKKDADGKLELKDGNPIYVRSDGTEMTVEDGTIARLNGEAKTYREERDTARNELSTFKEKFKGIENPDDALKAIETVKKIDQKKLIDAGEVDRVRNEISEGFKSQIVERDKRIGDLTGTVDRMTLDNAFANSSFVKEKIAVPEDMFRAHFSSHFKIEEGKVVPYDASGTKIFSKTRLGEIADFNEALEIIVGNYSNKDAILKAEGHSGSGNDGGGGRGKPGARTIKRAEFSAATPVQQAEYAALTAKGEMNIVD